MHRRRCGLRLGVVALVMVCALVGASSPGVAATPRSPRVEIRPDALIRKHGAEGYRGNNIYNNNASNQSRTLAASPGNVVVFDLRIENDGTEPNPYLVHGQAGNTAKFRVRYFSGQTEITSEVASGYWLPELAAGERRVITMRVTVKSGAAPGATLTRLISVYRAVMQPPLDAVRATARRS